MLFSRSKRSSLYLIIVVIFLCFLQVLRLSLEYSRGKEGQSVTFSYVYADQRASCWVSTARYFFEIPRCELLTLGSVLTITGTPVRLSDNGIFGVKKLSVSSISLSAEPDYSVKSWAQNALRVAAVARSKAVASLESYLEEPTAGIVSALLFGGRWRMSNEAQSLFETIGILHIAAASGFHLSIVMRFVGGVLGWLPRRLMAGALMSVAVLYLAVTGASPSMLRACVAFCLGFIGRHLWWRPIQPFRLFLYGAVVLAAASPQLLFSIAFQLSVAATAGIFVFSRPFLQNSLLEKMFTSGVSSTIEHQDARKTPLMSYLQESLIISCGAQLGVTPLLLYHFQETTLFGILATTAVSWLLPALFLAGWLAVGSAAVVSFEWLAFPAWALASMFLWILRLPENVATLLQLQLEVSVLEVGGMYGVLALIALRLNRRASTASPYVRLSV
jgi:ComEC/Rec2-related protein